MKVISVFLLLFFSNFIFSQENQILNELRQASEITDNGQRLKAFDTIMLKYNLKILQDTSNTSGKWITSVKIDPMNDEKIIIFTLAADIGKSIYDENIYLVIRYTNEKTDFYINWKSYIGDDPIVTMRIGSEKAIKNYWSNSSNSQASFYPGNVSELITQILKETTLVFQVTPYSENPITAIFDITGLKDAAAPYSEILKW